ncbi:cAMP dependent protein kinase, partial [Thalassiosira pseudonana CCMP1335]
SIADFDIGVTLGTGSFGRVRFATHTGTNQHYAVKMLRKSDIIKYHQVEHIMSEKEILYDLSIDHHPFIVNLAASFQDDCCIYMVIECVIGGEFFSYLRNAGKFNNQTSRFFAAHVVLIFEHLHAKDIIYRDLKPENLLLDTDGYLKITDFGFAKKVAFKTFTLCGTPEYIAPEVLLNKGHGKGVDWWTLGILMYEMMVGEPPFLDEDPMRIYQQILTGKISFTRSYDKYAKSLTKKLLTADLTKRYGCLKAGALDIKTSKWFNEIDWEALFGRKLQTPIKPKLSSAIDTSNFEEYPEDMDDLEPPIFDGVDPFDAF